MNDYILIQGAGENNLKDLSLKIPKKQAAKSRRELNDTFPSFVQQRSHDSIISDIV